MAMRCPDCGGRIRGRDVDVSADRVTCRTCGKLMSFVAISGAAGSPAGARHAARPASMARPEGGTPSVRERGGGPAADPTSAPSGAWFRDDGVMMEVGASTRSVGLGVVMLLLGAFWCSITGAFVVVSIVAILQGVGVVGGASSGSASLGTGVFMLLFSIPFVLVGCWMLYTSLMSFGGRVVVTLRGDDLAVFTGVGSMGRTRRVAASMIERVEEHISVRRSKNGTTTTRSILLAVPVGKGVKFGGMLADARRQFMLAILKQTIGR